MAANFLRAPLASRQNPSNISIGSSKLAVGGIKRPRSPDTVNDANSNHAVASKRIRSQTHPTADSTAHTTARDGRRERKTEKLLKEEEFKEKYTKAFPKWKFYFDTDDVEPAPSKRSLQAKVQHLGGTIEDFFDVKVTHLITNKDPSAASSASFNKENARHFSSQLATKSPAKRARLPLESTNSLGNDPLSKALSWSIKIWSYEKLASVLARCIPASQPKTAGSRQPMNNDLGRLLQTEKIKGSAEVDPSSKRFGWSYFSKGSYFLLVEDVREEIAPPYIHEYQLPKKAKESDTKKPWPVLYCHPLSRGPFIPFDEKEKRRWEKGQATQKKEEAERIEAEERRARLDMFKRRMLEVPQSPRRAGDLRRSVSMNNLQRQQELDVDLDADDSVRASGYLASGQSGYVAASGNSVSITSTTGTTSTAGYSLGYDLPASLRTRMSREVLTSRKPATGLRQENDKENDRPDVMGPPSIVPEKRARVLRRTASTNSIRLPKRDEGQKPGYCECCRQKFEDFRSHIEGRKHRKFATNDANFSQLDCVLARVKRRTLAEVREQAAMQNTQYSSEYDDDVA